VLTVDSLCVGPGRFVDDELTPPKGVGSSLLKHIVCWANEQDKIRTIILDTSSQAKRFYLEKGFEIRKDWQKSRASGWMELQREKWDKIINVDKYNHVMSDAAPNMSDGEWKSLTMEVYPPIMSKILLCITQGHGTNPFIKKIMTLPTLYEK